MTEAVVVALIVNLCALIGNLVTARRTAARVSEVHEQVHNSHETNLRVDLDGIRSEVRAGRAENRETYQSVRELRGDLVQVREDIRGLRADDAQQRADLREAVLERDRRFDEVDRRLQGA